jgi:hypothetical protein
MQISSGALSSQAFILAFIVIASTWVSVAESMATEPNLAAETDVEPLTFNRDVMAVLSKAGCNAGTCHGNVNGKGGFFLSLRGQDPVYDYEQLVRSADGRRINRMEPAQSLTLLKATAAVAHQGGKRFDQSSPEFKVLSRWIEAGLVPPSNDTPKVVRLSATPADQVLWGSERSLALSVTAHFADGTTRDVTRMAVYEPDDSTCPGD